MASIIKKRKGKNIYYYFVRSERVDGNPRIVKQSYLGTAETIARMVKSQSAPSPIKSLTVQLGLPAALWFETKRCGVLDALLKLWPKPRSGPSVAHYLVLAAIHRVCAPGPKTEVERWYDRSVLRRLWKFDSKRFTSQAFGDAFSRIGGNSEKETERELEQAQSLLLGAFRDKDMVGRRVFAYDTTNFHTWIATTNERSKLAQRGHNKQKRHDLRQVGLSYVLDGQSGVGLCHHVYPGNVSDSHEMAQVVDRLSRLLDSHGIDKETVTLVMDKGSASLANTLELERAGMGWISALPWNQAPESLREHPVEKLEPLGPRHPGVTAIGRKEIVHGGERLAVLRHSASFSSEQQQSIHTSLAKALGKMQRLSRELLKPGGRHTEKGITKKIERWLCASFVRRLVKWELEPLGKGKGWSLNFSLDHGALRNLTERRLGRTVLMTNRMDWSARQVVEAYEAQQNIERVFRGLKQGEWLKWGPMYHWTDGKIRVHAFCCMLGISLLQSLHRRAETIWPELSMEQLIKELGEINEEQILYPSLGKTGTPRVAQVLKKETLVQQALVKGLELDQLI